MTVRESEELVKVIFDVNDDTFGVGGEGVWARPMGNDLYEIRNTPWHTCEINWGDIVTGVPEQENQNPKIVEVVQRSGHRTLHIYFMATTENEKMSVLTALKDWKASFENCDGKLYAIDVDSGGDFEGLCEYLDGWGKGDKLDYRTVVSGKS